MEQITTKEQEKRERKMERTFKNFKKMGFEN